MDKTIYDCEMTSRKPGSVGLLHGELAKLVPMLHDFYYFVDGDQCVKSETFIQFGPEFLAVGYEHWVPGDVYSQLTGTASGATMAYRGREAALADLGLAWAKARPDGKRVA